MTQVPAAIRALLTVAMTLSSAVAWSDIPERYHGRFKVRKCTTEGGSTNLCKEQPTSVLISKDRIGACHGAVGRDGCDSGPSVRPWPDMYMYGATLKEHSGKDHWISIFESYRYSKSIQINEFGQRLIKLTIRENCSEHSIHCEGPSGFSEIWLDR